MPPSATPSAFNDRKFCFTSDGWTSSASKTATKKKNVVNNKMPKLNFSKRSSCAVWFCRACFIEEPEVMTCTIIGGPKIQPKPSWRSQLLKFSTWASMLCIVDCTILPLLTILLPLLGLVALDESWLHEVGHTVALCIVLPIGALATTTNFCLAHQRLWIAAIGWLGMLSIFIANGEHHCHGIVDNVFGHDTVMGRQAELYMHTVHHGLPHRVANLSGCALLMCSNYLSKTVLPPTHLKNKRKNLKSGNSV